MASILETNCREYIYKSLRIYDFKTRERNNFCRGVLCRMWTIFFNFKDRSKKAWDRLSLLYIDQFVSQWSIYRSSAAWESEAGFRAQERKVCAKNWCTHFQYVYIFLEAKLNFSNDKDNNVSQALKVVKKNMRKLLTFKEIGIEPHIRWMPISLEVTVYEYF